MKASFCAKIVGVGDAGAGATFTAGTNSCAKAEQLGNTANTVDNKTNTLDRRCTIGFVADRERRFKLVSFTTFAVFSYC